MIEEIPREFYCPLTGNIMKDPVITSDGFCFERSAISEWFGKGNKTNPITFIELDSTKLISNNPLRSLAGRFSKFQECMHGLVQKCDKLEAKIIELQDQNRQLMTTSRKSSSNSDTNRRSLSK